MLRFSDCQKQKSFRITATIIIWKSRIRGTFIIIGYNVPPSNKQEVYTKTFLPSNHGLYFLRNPHTHAPFIRNDVFFLSILKQVFSP